MFSDWLLDETWISNALKLARKVDTVSLDIFDTALTRTFYSPADVFAEVERRLCADGLNARGFAQAREDAERHARRVWRRSHDLRDITFDHIYSQLQATDAFPTAIVETAKRTELATERATLQAVPDVLELTRQLLRLGKPYVFVSDMYLPEEFLAELLTEKRYRGWSGLYVSGAHNATKGSGTLWPIVKGRHGELLHIGDDETSDYASAQRANIRALEYTRCRSFRRSAPSLTPALLPLSRAQRATEFASRADPIIPPDAARQMHALGETFGAIVVGAFIRWLNERVRRHGVDHLYFFSRDGWLLHNAWRAAGFSSAASPDSYLYTARRPFNFAAGLLDSAPDRIDAATLEFILSKAHGATVDVALKRLGLDAKHLGDAHKSLGGASHQRMRTQNREKLLAYLRAKSGPIHALLQETYTATCGYLRQEAMFSHRRVGIVDIGWHGQLQRALRRIGRSVRDDFDVIGFYYGLLPAALRNRYVAGPMEAAFSNEFCSWEQQYFLTSGIDLLEELHTAPHGSVASFALDRGRFAPTFLHTPLERIQYERHTANFQAGVIDALTSIFHGGGHLGIHVEDLTLENAQAAISAVVLSPSPGELELFSTLGHCGGFDHDVFIPLIPREAAKTQVDREKILAACSWKVGALRRWRDSADGAASRRIAELAKDTLSFLDERTLLQFG